jgi:quinoprotein glucose dehydrogenase
MSVYFRAAKWRLREAAALLAGLVEIGAAPAARKAPYTTWSDYAGGADSMQYSALKQINKANVAQLELAWFLPAPGPSGRFAFNPLIVDDVMYVVGKGNAVMALNAATGKEIWSHPVDGAPTNRGFNYWESPDRSDRRLIFAANSYLQEINAKTGVTINTFGKDGRVNLREGLGRDPKTIGQIQSGTPGRVFDNLIIVGSAPGELYGSAPGDLRAYDVKTGEMKWVFHTIPHPGEFGYETWPKDAWTYSGGVNAWGEIAIDEKRGIAYFPLGSPTFDMYGADRKGANLFGNSLVALDARTGKRLWHFQAVHHDLWDYDLTTGPKLLTVKHRGKPVDIVAQATKFGLLYVFNRETGEPLWPIEERAVPQTDVPGEETSKTQPFPTKPPPFARITFSPGEINPYLDAADAIRIKEILLRARNEGIFTPPSHLRNAVTMPGELGGSNWAGSAGDPQTGMLYVRSADQPATHILLEQKSGIEAASGSPPHLGRAVFVQHCQLCHPDRKGILVPKTVGVERFQSVVRTGQNQMPAFADAVLTPANLDALVIYLNNPEAASAAGPQRTGNRPPPPPPPPGQTRYMARLGAMFVGENGLSAIGPPWAQLTAYDLNQGTIKWQIPIGTVAALAAKGIKNTGNNYRIHKNGPVVTGGGLIFLGTWGDRTLHAYDKDSGKLLWDYPIEATPEGIPAIYESGGRQFAAFFASAGSVNAGSIAGIAGKPEAQGYYVFALPQRKRSPNVKK